MIRKIGMEIELQTDEALTTNIFSNGLNEGVNMLDEKWSYIKGVTRWGLKTLKMKNDRNS